MRHFSKDEKITKYLFNHEAMSRRETIKYFLRTYILSWSINLTAIMAYSLIFRSSILEIGERSFDIFIIPLIITIAATMSTYFGEN